MVEIIEVRGMTSLQASDERAFISYREAALTRRRQDMRAQRAVAVPDWVTAPGPPLVQASQSSALALSYTDILPKFLKSCVHLEAGMEEIPIISQ